MGKKYTPDKFDTFLWNHSIISEIFTETERNEFNSINLEEKQATVWEKGVFLDNYITKDIKINCYAIDKFFVEVVYDAEHNIITEVRSFKYGHSLDKYAPKL